MENYEKFLKASKVTIGPKYEELSSDEFKDLSIPNDIFEKDVLKLLEHVQYLKKVFELNEAEFQKVQEYIQYALDERRRAEEGDKNLIEARIMEVFKGYQGELVYNIGQLETYFKNFSDFVEKIDGKKISHKGFSDILPDGCSEISKETFAKIFDHYSTSNLLSGLESLKGMLSGAGIDIYKYGEYSKEEKSFIDDVNRFFVSYNDLEMMKRQKSVVDEKNNIEANRIAIRTMEMAKYLLKENKRILTTPKSICISVDARSNNGLYDTINEDMRKAINHDIYSMIDKDSSLDLIMKDVINGTFKKENFEDLLESQLEKRKSELKKELKKVAEKNIANANKLDLLLLNRSFVEKTSNLNREEGIDNEDSSRVRQIAALAKCKCNNMPKVVCEEVENKMNKKDMDIDFEVGVAVLNEYEDKKGKRRVDDAINIYNKLKDDKVKDALPANTAKLNNREKLLKDIISNMIDKEEIGADTNYYNEKDIGDFQEKIAENEISCKSDRVYYNADGKTIRTDDFLYFSSSETKFNRDATGRALNKTLVLSGNESLPKGYTLKIENIPMNKTYESYIKNIRDRGLQAVMLEMDNTETRISIYNNEGKPVFAVMDGDNAVVGSETSKLKDNRRKLVINESAVGNAGDLKKLKDFKSKLNSAQKIINGESILEK